MERLTTHALGTTVTVQANRARWAVDEIIRLGQVLTRFAESPLTQLNREGILSNPPDELVLALEHALCVAERTQGLVTPTVLGALEAAGYTCSFEHLEPLPDTACLSTVRVPDWHGIEVSSERIRVPAGVRLDLSGTAKTWIIEQVATVLEGDFLIDAGGDIAVRQSTPFALKIEHPRGLESLHLELPAGRWGVATSSTQKRAWVGGHHLIDPRSGQPLHSRFVQVSAVTDQATEAEVLTKLALLDEAMLIPQAGEAFVLAFDVQGCAWQWHGAGFALHALEPLEAA